MRDWPWPTIILTAFVASFAPLPFDGWLNMFLFFGAILGSIAYAVHVRRLP